MEKRKIIIKEESLISQTDEDCLFIMSPLPSLKKLDDTQRLELGIYLSSVTRRIQISTNLSPPLIVSPQHLTFRAHKLHLRLRQVSIQHIPGIQTLQRIHCRCPVSQAQICCHVSFGFNSESF